MILSPFSSVPTRVRELKETLCFSKKSKDAIVFVFCRDVLVYFSLAQHENNPPFATLLHFRGASLHRCIPLVSSVGIQQGNLHSSCVLKQKYYNVLGALQYYLKNRYFLTPTWLNIPNLL